VATLDQLTTEGLVPARQTANKLRGLATAFLENLDRDQRAMAIFDFDNEAERRDWDFIPKSGRNGLPFRLMTMHQQTLAHMLLAASVSLPTYAKVVQIMANEHVLRELNGPRMGPAAVEFRNPGNYYFSFFGMPNMEKTWGWRVVGHHVSLNFTLVGGIYLNATPCLLGNEPAEFGAMKPLKEDEDAGFDLLYALAGSQRSRAVIHDVAPPNFASRVVTKLGQEERPATYELGFDGYRISEHDRETLKWIRSEAKGVAASEFDDAQMTKLNALIECYVARMPEEPAQIEMDRLRAAGIENVHFCWAGGQERGTPHYYRLQGPSFLVEFENAQMGGNHIHSVWRDPDNDFGYDALARHYAEAHHPEHITNVRVNSTMP
jgi:hypothetical protein